MGPYVLGLYSKNYGGGAIASIISGVSVTIILVAVFGMVDGGKNVGEIINLGIKRAPLIGVIDMIFHNNNSCSSAFTKKPDKEHLDFVSPKKI